MQRAPQSDGTPVKQHKTVKQSVWAAQMLVFHRVHLWRSQSRCNMEDLSSWSAVNWQHGTAHLAGLRQLTVGGTGAGQALIDLLGRLLRVGQHANQRCVVQQVALRRMRTCW